MWCSGTNRSSTTTRREPGARACPACPSCRRSRSAARGKAAHRVWPGLALDRDAADEVRGRVAARAVVPPAVDAVAAVGPHGLRREVGERAAEVAVAEQLDLALLGPHRRPCGRGRRSARRPSRSTGSPRQLDRDAQEGLQPELEAAEAPGCRTRKKPASTYSRFVSSGRRPSASHSAWRCAQRVAHRGGARHQLVGVADVRSPDAHLPAGDRTTIAQPVLRSPAAMPLTVSSSARASGRVAGAAPAVAVPRASAS